MHHQPTFMKISVLNKRLKETYDYFINVKNVQLHKFKISIVHRSKLVK